MPLTKKKTKVVIELLLTVRLEYTDEELADLYPGSVLADTSMVIREIEHASINADPAQYAALMLVGGAKVEKSVAVVVS